MKLEAVILAAGPGSRMVELTRGKPKCLLPVGNQSLIWFAITGLRSVGVSRIIILLPDSHENDIKQYCHKKFASFKDLTLEFCSVSTKADCGTAESLYSIKEKIRGDFIVHSCDSLIDPKALNYMVNHYRLYDPMLTMLLLDNPDYFKSRPVPGKREKERYMRDVIAVEPLDELDLTANEDFSANRLVFIHSERDLKQKLRIRNKDLVLHSSLSVYSSFLDSHVYIFKKGILEFMKQNSDKAVLKAEMIPLLVSRQFCKRGQSIDEDDDVSQIMIGTRLLQDYEVELRDKLESLHPRNIAHFPYLKKASAPKPSACNALIVKNLSVHRVNTLGGYIDCNRDARGILNSFGLKNLTTVKDCVVGESSTFGEKCTLKRGSIGSNCKIGDKVKLFDCVIMDNVEIDSNSTLTECIVGSGSKIGSKCDMKSCIIGYKQVVPNGRKSNSEVVIDDGYAIDLGNPVIFEDE